jgi:hypothetical protein
MISKAIHPAVYTELHMWHKVLRLTKHLFVIIISHTTCFYQADHYQVLILYKELRLEVKT